MNYEHILALLSPAGIPVEDEYLWAKFELDGVIPGCEFVYYCVNDEQAAELLVNQIKPRLEPGQCYLVVFPISDVVDIQGDETGLSSVLSVVHFGWYDNWKSEAIARTHVAQYLAYIREVQNRWVSGIRISSSNFSRWADDNSTLQQYTTIVNVTAVEPYALAPNCPQL